MMAFQSPFPTDQPRLAALGFPRGRFSRKKFLSCPSFFFPSLHKINRAADGRAEGTGGYRGSIQAAE